MDPNDLREQVELEVVDFIKLKLDNGEITDIRAQQLAQRALEVIRPGMNLQELHEAIPTLDDTMPEFAPVILPYVRDYETNITTQALENVRNLIKQGQYDAAADVGKKASSRSLDPIWTGSSKPSTSSDSKT
jgi:hypothetical protein